MALKHAASRFKQRVAHSSAVRSPFSILVRRAIAKGRIKPGATIIIVNWNSLDFLRVAIDAIRQFTSSDAAEILVLDNASKDGSREYLRSKGVRFIGLPSNIGHEMALDLGALISRREFIVALDVDAFPISSQWLHRMLEPLRNGLADVSGVHVEGGFVHPCCLAMRLDRFVWRNHTFMPMRSGIFATSADDPEPAGWDTGWSISLREKRRNLIDRTEVYGPGNIGSVWDEVVYHNFYSTRFDAKILPSDEEIASGVNRLAAEEAWKWAVNRFMTGAATNGANGA